MHIIPKLPSKQLFSTIKSLGIIGAGQMGTGIAIVASTVAKLPVVLYDSNDISLKNSEKYIGSWFDK
jgi:3-hydroxybutyryl-CoA dehydrogenase